MICMIPARTCQVRLGVNDNRSDIMYDEDDSAAFLEGRRHENASHSQGVETSNSKDDIIL